MKQKFHRQNYINHFRSQDHCKIAAALQNKGDAVNTTIEQQRHYFYAASLPQAVIDDVIVSCARKSLSLTAVSVVLDVAQRALCACQAEKHLTPDEIMTVRKVSPQSATSITRLNALTKPVKTSHGLRAAIRRGRTAITNRMRQLGKETLTKKVENLLACKLWESLQMNPTRIVCQRHWLLHCKVVHLLLSEQICLSVKQMSR